MVLSKIARGVGFFWAVVLAISIYRLKTYSGEPLGMLIPGFLLFTPFRPMTAITRYLFLPELTEEIEPTEIPTIPYEEYTWEKLRDLTEGWQSPAVVRGMFKNTTAYDRWGEPGYVSSIIGDFVIETVMNGVYNSTQSKKQKLPFRDVYEEILADPNSTKYMFFPMKSRVSLNNVNEVINESALQEAINNITRVDLDFDRIWKGFGSKNHKNYMFAQFIAGNGQEGATTGSFWHCAAGNNWFIQVIGAKRWWFIDQRYSSYMRPQRHGAGSFALGERRATHEFRYLPMKYVDMQAGDMLYNPDFEWHAIENHVGLSVAVPAREGNVTLMVKNNLQFSMVVLVNRIFANLGIHYGLRG